MTTDNNAATEQKELALPAFPEELRYPNFPKPFSTFYIGYQRAWTDYDALQEQVQHNSMMQQAFLAVKPTQPAGYQPIYDVYGMPMSYIPVDQEAEWQQLKQEEEDLNNQIFRLFEQISFWANAPILILAEEGQPGSGISTAAEWVEKFGPTHLTPEDIAEMEMAIEGWKRQVPIEIDYTEPDQLTEEEKEELGFLGIDPEDEEAVRAYLTAPTQPLPLKGIHDMTVEEIRKYFVPQGAALPEGMNMEELLETASMMDIPEEAATEAMDIYEAVSIVSDAAKELQETIDAVVAGEKSWEIPELSVGEQLMLTLQQPMQVVAELMRPYIENVSYPLAGMVTQAFQNILPGTQFVEERYDQLRAEGVHWWDAARQSWIEWDAPWIAKFGIEILTDPLTYIPGWGLSKPGMALTKTGRLGQALGLRSIGTNLLRFNEGLWKVTDIPFDAAKALRLAIRDRFGLRAISGTIRDTTMNFQRNLWSAVELYTGKLHHLIEPEDVIKTLNHCEEMFRLYPLEESNIYVSLGRYMRDIPPMGAIEIRNFASKIGADVPLETARNVEFMKTFNDIMGGMAYGGMSDMDYLKAMAMHLGAEESSEVMARLSKAMPEYINQYARRAVRAAQIAQNAQVGKTIKMVSYLVDTQRRIITNTVRHGYGEGQVMKGVIAGLVNGVDAIERFTLRQNMDRYLVKPLAESYLGNPSYFLGNVFEGWVVSALEGVLPRRANYETFLMVSHGLMNVPQVLRDWAASDVMGLLGNLPGRHGAFSLLPGKIPERVLGVRTPEWIAGREWFEWAGRKWIELSDTWGTAFRANFWIKKFNNRVADMIDDVGGVNVNQLLSDAVPMPPEIANMPMKANELRQEIIARVFTNNRENILSMKTYISNLEFSLREQRRIVGRFSNMSPAAKDLADEYIGTGRLMSSAENIVDFTTRTARQTIDDLRARTTAMPDIFNFMADQIDNTPINSADDLMNIFQHYELMEQTAGNLPHEMMSRVFDNTDALYRAGQYGRIERTFRETRQQLIDAMNSINASMERVRVRMLGHLDLLKPRQRQAFQDILTFRSGREQLYQEALRADSQLLDDFWQLPRSQRTAEVHSELRAYRRERWSEYEIGNATLDANRAIERSNYAQLYYRLPKQKLQGFNAQGRALSRQDVAQIVGCNVDNLTSGTLESLTYQKKPNFVQYIKTKARAHPRTFRGVTEEKIAAVYDEILDTANFSKALPVEESKVWKQAEMMQEELLHLRMTKMMQPTEEAALHQWIDDVAKNVEPIFGKEGRAVRPTAITSDAEIARLLPGNVESRGWQAADVPPTDPTDIANTLGITYGGTVDRAGVTHFQWTDSVTGSTFETTDSVFANVQNEFIQLRKDWKAAVPEPLEFAEGRWIFEEQLPDGQWAQFGGKNLQEAYDEMVELHKRFEIPPPADIPRRIKPGKVGGVVTETEWNAIREEAGQHATFEMNKAFADYTNQDLIDTMGKMIYPFWTYHMYRWFFLPRLFIRHPGIAAAWGKYNNYTEYGYFHIPGTDLDLSPWVGTAMGPTFGLVRRDFRSYYENLGVFGEFLDYTQRFGFFPGAHVSLPLMLSPILAGRPPELGEALPPLYRAGLEFLIGSDIPGVSDLAQNVQNRIFHSNFRDYYTATIVSDMQVKAGGTLIGGQSGVDLWHKLQRGETLTAEEQLVWDEAKRETAWYALLRSEFPQFRMKEEEQLAAYKEVTEIFERTLGMSEDFQNRLWRQNMRPTDVVGGLPLALRQELDLLWQYRIWFGRGQTLMPPSISNLYGLINKYWDRVETYQTERADGMVDINEGFLNPTNTLHFNGSEWRAEQANLWDEYVARVEALEQDPEYRDVMDAITPEGQVRLAKELGFRAPARHPIDEALDLYFSVELVKTADPYTGEEDWDYLKFWVEREAVRQALTPAQRGEFDNYVRKYETPLETVFRKVNDTYFRGYRAITRILAEEYPDEARALIAEYYADGTTRERKDEIQAVQYEGRGLISGWNSRLTETRITLRRQSPQLDFWLYVFGYITSPRTDAARAMIEAWEADRSSILTMMP